ncbi:MAG: zinc ABC transporter substrate-binding protein, partial [Clostridia bacterium]|nr:zinc ABC transporter substrate-binding protein [Clostridia bacterium]
MKKIISAFIAVMLMAGCLTACTSNKQGNSENSKLEIVTTIYPEYDWVNQILGENRENANVTLLINKGVDLHSYQPTAEDILKISKCDIFIYVGGESDKWVEDVLKQAGNDKMIVLNLLEILGDKAKDEEIVEGMQEDSHDHEEEESHEEEEEKDEHVWLSLKNASLFCDKITEALIKADGANEQAYKANLEAYKAKLNALDKEFESASQGAAVKTLIFGDRFPFRYLLEDYGLNYYAAFAGCSSETEASFETIAFLAKKADELQAKYIIAIEGSDNRI